MRSHLLLATASVLLITTSGSAATFSSPAPFEGAIGAGNLTTLDFEGLVTPPNNFAVVNQVDGVSFMTSGSDVILATSSGEIQNGEQDRTMEITFPEPVTAVSVDMLLLDMFNNPAPGATIRGKDGVGVEIFSAHLPSASFFFGYFDAANPITTLLLEPDSGGRSVVDTMQYSTTTVPEPAGAALIALLAPMTAAGRKRSARELL